MLLVSVWSSWICKTLWPGVSAACPGFHTHVTTPTGPLCAAFLPPPQDDFSHNYEVTVTTASWFFLFQKQHRNNTLQHHIVIKIQLGIWGRDSNVHLTDKLKARTMPCCLSDIRVPRTRQKNRAKGVGFAFHFFSQLVLISNLLFTYAGFRGWPCKHILYAKELDWVKNVPYSSRHIL